LLRRLVEDGAQRGEQRAGVLGDAAAQLGRLTADQRDRGAHRAPLARHRPLRSSRLTSGRGRLHPQPGQHRPHPRFHPVQQREPE
jgi:hypothetical protein